MIQEIMFSTRQVSYAQLPIQGTAYPQRCLRQVVVPAKQISYGKNASYLNDLVNNIYYRTKYQISCKSVMHRVYSFKQNVSTYGIYTTIYRCTAA